MIPSPEIKELTVKDIIQIIFKRIRMIGTLVAVAVICLALYGIFAPKTYTATTMVLLKKSPLELQDPKKAPIAKERWRKEDYQTQITLLHSRFIAEQVIKVLDLPIGAKKLLTIVEVKAVKGTNMAEVAVSGRDPVEITDIANRWVQEFMRRDLAASGVLAQYGVSKLEKQLDDTLGNLQVAERELNLFVREHGDLAELEQLVERLKAQLVRLEEEIVEMSAMYGDRHQRMISLRQQLIQVREQLKEENERYLAVQDQMATYDVLRKKAETFRAIYEDLIMRAKQLGTAKGLAVSDIKVVDVATVPTKPNTLPVKVQLFVVMASLLAGLVGTFVLEYMDTSLQRPEEVELYTGLPFLGSIPTVTEDARGMQELCMVSQNNPHSDAAEAFRNIKVALNFAAKDEKQPSSVLITSSKGGEGKTFAACNFAIVSAHGNQSTLLIDGDMREGTIGNIFGAETNKGLSDLLAGKCSIDEAVTPTDVPHLSVMTSGGHIHNPADLLDSDKFRELFHQIKAKFQKVIVDVPAILKVSDILFWEDKCDGLVYVIAAGRTPFEHIQEGKKRLEKVPIIGAVLNKISEEKQDLPYYYHYFKNFLAQNNTE